MGGTNKSNLLELIGNKIKRLADNQEGYVTIIEDSSYTLAISPKITVEKSLIELTDGSCDLGEFVLNDEALADIKRRQEWSSKKEKEWNDLLDTKAKSIKEIENSTKLKDIIKVYEHNVFRHEVNEAFLTKLRSHLENVDITKDDVEAILAFQDALDGGFKFCSCHPFETQFRIESCYLPSVIITSILMKVKYQEFDRIDIVTNAINKALMYVFDAFRFIKGTYNYECLALDFMQLLTISGNYWHYINDFNDAPCILEGDVRQWIQKYNLMVRNNDFVFKDGTDHKEEILSLILSYCTYEETYIGKMYNNIKK